MARRVSKMECRQTERRSKRRKLPAFDAATCPGKTRKGRDGMYESVEASDGKWMWKKKMKGGFIPSVMGGVVRLGPSLMAAGMAQGSRLLSRRPSVRQTKRRRSNRS